MLDRRGDGGDDGRGLVQGEGLGRAARLAFANDLSAFSEGIQEALAARGITGGLVSALFDGPVIKEGVQS